MANESGVIVAVVLSSDPLKNRSLGNHRFVDVPRVGDEVCVMDDGKYVLKVEAVSYVGQSEEAQTVNGVQLLQEFSVVIHCKEKNARN